MGDNDIKRLVNGCFLLELHPQIHRKSTIKIGYSAGIVKNKLDFACFCVCVAYLCRYYGKQSSWNFFVLVYHIVY